MDLGMPIMDGFESCTKIKNFYKDSDLILETSARHIPEPILQLEAESGSEYNPQGAKQSPYIISLSASEYDSSLLERCKNAGFDDCFSVPLQISVLQEQVIDKILFQKALQKMPSNVRG